MPTLPKAIAAIFFAALGFFCADLIKPLLPEGTQTGVFNETMAIIGFFTGWTMSGARAGDGTWAGFGYGLTSSGLMVFWGALAFAGRKMLTYSIDKRFSGPIEAIQAMISFFLENLILIGTPTIIGTVIVGGMFGGWLTEWVAKRAS